MALQIFASNSTGAGVRADLTTVDDVVISAGVTVGSTTTDAIQGTGSGHLVMVQGTVIGERAIDIGTDFTTSSNQVIVGEAGQVLGFGSSTGLRISGTNSLLDNDGYIWGTVGAVIMGGQGGATTSRIVNQGTIESPVDAILRILGSTETFTINNTGLISSEDDAFDSNTTTAIERIVNSGSIVGDILLGNGDDLFNGISGRLSGDVLGGAGADVLRGGIDNDTFDGGADADTLNGGGGSDTLLGGLGKDSLVGGTGKDFFDFNLAAESGITPGTRDVIGDFRRSQADKIDLRGIDARDTPAGDQAFNFIGTKAFTGQEGQLRYVLQGNTTIIIGSIDTDKAAEFSIQLTGKIGLLAGDFLL